MALSDRTLVCVECGAEFIFTVGEQEFFQARGFGNEPQTLPELPGSAPDGTAGRRRDVPGRPAGNVSHRLRRVRQ